MEATAARNRRPPTCCRAHSRAGTLHGSARVTPTGARRRAAGRQAGPPGRRIRGPAWSGTLEEPLARRAA
ncbi:hypothetical protein V5799_022543 [Amblyomma americanum]|uniref:Uncharacterized protein n=1 Tax=Amblyomma americanum TaxID=6943 RepID=A0AAQ4FMH6_AMBAM